jgi:hypothetical protein
MGQIKLFLVASILLSVSAQGNENLIVNGGFEQPTVLDENLNYEHRIGNELTGWEVFSDSNGVVQFNSDYAAVSEGNQAVQLEDPGDRISQSFATTTTQPYTLSFDLSAHPQGGDASLRVDVGNVSVQLTGMEIDYVRHSIDFQALSDVTTLTFTGIAPYPHLDNISVVWTGQLVTIDIKPSSDPVCDGVIPIVILGSDTLDVIQIDQATLSFEGEGVRVRRNGVLSCKMRDANRDGYDDLVCRYEDTTTEGTLTGELLDGTPIEGADTFCLGN